MSEQHAAYLFDLGSQIKQMALDARTQRDGAVAGSAERELHAGRLLAYYEVVSRMKNQAIAFEIPTHELQLDDIDPDRDLT